MLKLDLMRHAVTSTAQIVLHMDACSCPVGFADGDMTTCASGLAAWIVLLQVQIRATETRISDRCEHWRIAVSTRRIRVASTLSMMRFHGLPHAYNARDAVSHADTMRRI